MKKIVFASVFFVLVTVGCLRAQDVPTLDIPCVVLEGHTDEVRVAAFSPDGKKIIPGSDDCTARIWDVESGETLHELKGHRFQVRQVAFFPDGKRAFTASGDKVQIWDVESGEMLHRLEANRIADVSFSALSPDGRRIVMASRDKTARIWDTDSGKELHRLEGHAGEVSRAAFSPDCKRVVTAGKDNALRIWDVESGKELQKLEEQTEWVFTIVFSPDGKKIVSEFSDGGGPSPNGGSALPRAALRIWDAESGKKLQKLEHRRAIATVAFSSDGSKIVTACHDGVGRIWDVESGEELCKLLGHYSTNSCAAFSTDGKIVVSGGGLTYMVPPVPTCLLHFFDAKSGEPLLQIPVRGLTMSVAFSPDGTIFVSTSSDGTARIWALEQITKN